MTEKMKTACFNLVDEPWLPVTLADDFPDAKSREPLPRVSLREAFEHGDKIVDLRCYPHERIALMRLLICIAQTALNGPTNEADWNSCGKRLAKEAVKYLTLKANTSRFNVFGDGPRFLQAKPRRKATTFSTQKFRFIDEDGPTLFDAHVEPGCALNPADLAVGVVVFQSFAAGGRVEGAAESIPGGLCREGSALHAFLLGDSLLDSIWLNLVPKDQIAENRVVVFGDASWHGEKDAAKSRLYRLAPVARYLWLANDGAFVEGRGGRTLLTFEKDGVRELTAAVRTVRQSRGAKLWEKEELVSATAGGGVPKAAWRELHAMAVLRSSRRRGGPAALQHCVTFQLARSHKEIRLWCGALIGGGKNRAAAVGDVIESVFRLPVAFLDNADAVLVNDPLKCPGPNQTYRDGVGLAEQWRERLQDAVFTYHVKLTDREGAKKTKNQAAMRFWTTLEQLAERVLLHDVAMNSDKYWSDKTDWMAKSPWGKEVWKAAHDAYDFACPHGTPRQLRGYAAGLAVLRGESQKRPASVATVGERSNAVGWVASTATTVSVGTR